jgi:hypothetical protein
MNGVLSHIIRFIALLALQLFVVDQMQLSGFIRAWIYVLFVAMLPPTISRFWLLVLAFTTGLIYDFFSGAHGLHTAAMTLIGFMRPFILRFFTGKGFNEIETLSLSAMGIGKFVTYTGTVVVIHHFTVFLLESFKWSDFHFVLLRTVGSSIFTMISLILIVLITGRVSR